MAPQVTFAFLARLMSKSSAKQRNEHEARACEYWLNKKGPSVFLRMNKKT